MGSSKTASVQMQGEASGVCRTASRDGEWPGLGGRSTSGWQGQIRMGSLGSGREGNGGRGSWAACKPQRSVSLSFSLSQPTGLETLGVRAQPSCQICRLLLLPRTNRPQAWGAHILSPTTHYTACGHHLPAPLQHLRSSLGHRCLFTLMGEQRWGAGAVLREISLSETLPPRDHTLPSGGVGVRSGRDSRDGGADVRG